MSKDLLKTKLNDASIGLYNWTLYFFTIDRRSPNPYIVHKIRFRRSDSLQKYARALMQTEEKYKIEKIEQVQLYTGENSKVVCDKISLCNNLIKKDWEYLFNDIANASDEKIQGKYNGYILIGVPIQEDKSSVTAIKMANPIIDMHKQKSIVFNFTEENELDIISDNICRLHMDVDMLIIGDWLYSFNLKAEVLFNMEKTMQKIKNDAIQNLLKIDAFSNEADFEKYAKSYPSARTFITLNQERVKKLENRKQRKKVADMLKLQTDAYDRICFKNKEEVALLIKYICFKMFKDDETKGLLEASNVTKVAR